MIYTAQTATGWEVEYNDDDGRLFYAHVKQDGSVTFSVYGRSGRGIITIPDAVASLLRDQLLLAMPLPTQEGGR